eukprot:11175093-Lingulodinium_polyedra.AAC.1
MSCAHVQVASASVDERPSADAEQSDEYGDPECGNSTVDRWLTKIHVNCGHVHPTVLAQCL